MIFHTIRDSVQELQSHGDSITKFYEGHRGEIAAVSKALAKIEDKLIRAQACPDCIDLHISGDRHVLNAVFGAFRRLGYQPDNRPEKHEPQYSTYFRHDEHQCVFWVSFASSECKRIKVGTKTQTIDVYETVCE